MNDTEARSLFLRFRKAGDPDDFAAFYDATVSTVLDRARRLAPERDAADDLVQATYVAAMTSAARFDRKRDVLAWLLGIMANQARAMRWRRRRQPDAERLAWPEPDDPADIAEDREFCAQVDGAIADLGPVYQPVVILHLQHGLSAAEIGKALDRPAGTVRTQLVRGLARLRAALPPSLASTVLVQVASAHGATAVRAAVLARASELASPATQVAAAGAPIAFGTAALAVCGALLAGVAAVMFWPTTEANRAVPDPAQIAAGGPSDRSSATNPDPAVLSSVVRIPHAAPVDVAVTGEDPTPGAALRFDALFGAAPPPSGAGGAYGGRHRGRERLARAAAPISGAIGSGLEWLARHQADDGRWDAGTPGAPTRDVFTTALASLAFLHDGKHGRGTEHPHVVSRGVFWLLQQQDRATGAIGDTSTARGLLHHAAATLAIVECYGLTENLALAPFARSAVAHLVDRRAPQGYWTMYEAGEDRSAELSAWVVYALHAADVFRLAPRARSLVDDLGNLPTPTPRTRAARLVAHFFARGQRDERMREDVAEVLRAARTAPDAAFDTRLWISRGLYQVGGEAWKTWSPALAELVETQRGDGNFAGSWDPVAPRAGGGRTAATAFATLILETYYAHTRLVF